MNVTFTHSLHRSCQECQVLGLSLTYNSLTSMWRLFVSQFPVNSRAIQSSSQLRINNHLINLFTIFIYSYASLNIHLSIIDFLDFYTVYKSKENNRNSVLIVSFVIFDQFVSIDFNYILYF